VLQPAGGKESAMDGTSVKAGKLELRFGRQGLDRKFSILGKEETFE
jgi:hypothetical protein